MMRAMLMVGLVAIMISSVAFAGDEKDKDPAVKKIVDPAQFKALVVDLRKEMEPDGRYAYVKPDERVRVDADFSTIQTLLEKQAAGSTLSPDELAQQYTAQSEVNAILLQRDGEREICTRTAPLGSHIPKMTCTTYAHLQEKHANSQDMLKQVQTLNDNHLATEANKLSGH